MSKMRFIWVAALLALCLSAGGALAADSWNPTAETIPATMLWDQAAAASIDADNDGDTTWDSTYGIVSVEIPTSPLVAVERWGEDLVSVVGTVAPAGSYTFDLSLVAPPISTLTYATPIVPTHPAAASTLACNWLLESGGTPFALEPAAGNGVTITRFSDDAPGSAGAWAAAQIEECAGNVPFITAGTGATTFSPNNNVTRDQMAVFLKRALELPTAAFEARFVDVGSTFWAWMEIEALARSGITQGTDPTHFTPGGTVLRDQMAAFLARGLCGGEANVPTGPATATFTDVPTTYWAFDHVEYAVANNITTGTTPTTFSPSNACTRAQMAVFLYRSFIQSTDAVVVLAGPGVTDVDTSTVTYNGWSSITSGAQADPGDAYVGFDVVRAGVADITVDFVLAASVSPTAAVIASGTDTILAAEITAGKAAAATSGVPYVYATWSIPAAITPGDYVLKVVVNGYDPSVGVRRMVPFTILP